MKRLAVLPILAASAFGCAATPAPRAPDGGVLVGYFTPHRGTVAGDTYKVTTDGISSANVQIGRTPEGFRGTARRRLIELHVDGNEVLGALDGQPIRLAIEPAGERVLVHGLWGGRMVAFGLTKGAPPAPTPGQPSLTVDAPSAVGEDAPAADATAIAQTMAAKLDEREVIALLAVMLFTSSGSPLSPPSGPVHVGLPAAGRLGTTAPPPPAVRSGRARG